MGLQKSRAKLGHLPSLPPPRLLWRWMLIASLQHMTKLLSIADYRPQSMPVAACSVRYAAELDKLALC